MKDVLMICLVILFAGCSTKKKSVESSSSTVKTETVAEGSSSSNTQSETKTESKQELEQTEESHELEYDGNQGDSLTVTEKDAQGKVLKETIYKGKGKLKTKSGKKTTTGSSSQSTLEQKQDENKAEFKAKETDDHKQSNDKKAIHREGISFGVYLWISIAVLIAAVLYFLNKKFAWTKHVTSFVSKYVNLRKK